jgi:hypothetical protein
MQQKREGRFEVFQFRLSARERRQMESLAKAHKLKLSDYARRVVTGSLQIASRASA